MVANWTFSFFILKMKIILISDSSRKLIVLTSISATEFTALSTDNDAVILDICDLATFYLLEPILWKHRLSIGPLI